MMLLITKTIDLKHAARAVKTVVIVLLAVFVMPALAANPDHALVGLWQHESKPVVVQMSFADGLIRGIIHSHDDRPEAVGKTLFRDLAANSESLGWRGRVYVEQLAKEKDVSVILVNPGQFIMMVKVGFISRKLTWNRIAASAQAAPGGISPTATTIRG